MSATVQSGKDEVEVPQRRIIYVPWRGDLAGDFKPPKPFMNWDDRASNKTFEMYYQNHLPYVPFNFTGPTQHVTIYVRGHGRSGSARLSPTNQEGSTDATPAGLYEDFVEGGLAKTFAGRIKFYACESGLGGAASFACQCASLFRKNGFGEARFFGYVGTMTGAYEPHEGEWHKFVVPGDQRARTLRRPVQFDANNEAYISVI